MEFKKNMRVHNKWKASSDTLFKLAMVTETFFVNVIHKLAVDIMVFYYYFHL